MENISAYENGPDPGQHINHNDTDPTYDYESYSYDDYYHEHEYSIFDFEIVIYGYIWPVLVIITCLCNCLVIVGFLRKHMQTSAYIILVFIAISDSLTGLVTLPATFYVYSREQMFLSTDWCNVTMITRLYIARAFHTVSVWETVFLGFQRFLHLPHPAAANRWCTIKKTIGIVAVMYVLSFLLHMYHAFDIKTSHGFCHWKLKEPCGWGCAYIWASFILGHAIPCVALVAFTTLMLRSVSQIHRSTSVDNNIRRQKEQNRNTTIAILLIVVIFLIPELTYGLFYLLTMILKLSVQRILPLRTNRIFHATYELALVLSFHLNFWVYCVMIRSFRTGIKTLLKMARCKESKSSEIERERTSSQNVSYELVGISEREAEHVEM
ncbi:sex peptide receptor-related protein 2-like [Dreissena polymorpha]|uniref:G-protein coupled receptors family 1 profile domain-containing protein n=1 Tax=Dreissena polymorpha TaxID=45954 RepID=A0A9D4H6I1_DREPO|nr:sex peptide receptor-related protein 2-like [Dreissena polymorpha]XP_052286902.1 sex peptide receptor-related protein 2-like [Dreissena polymorpha]XP_052286903.1 sex peptide receptor-related protein 2-like [Dreissena polymorpha]KAH3829197.1 hypothetical protein DPMN_131190 [Dreissena polymorpha]